MGSHNRFRDRGDRIQLPPALDPVRMALMNQGQPAPNVGCAMHNRQIETADTVFINVPTPQGVILFPFGGYTKLEKAALMIAAASVNPGLNTQNEDWADDCVKLAQRVLHACQLVEPKLDPATGQPMQVAAEDSADPETAGG